MKQIIFLLVLVGFVSCQPWMEPDVELGPAPVASIQFTPLPGDPNRIVFTDASDGSFTRNWSFGNGAFSSQQVDTAYFAFAGEYVVTLSVAGRGGSSAASQTIVIAQNDPNACSNLTLVNLAGGCFPGDSGVWIFSQEAGAISVGPTELATDWYTSPAGGLVSEQYDDSWVFYIEDNHFQYFNSGLTVDPYQGYQALPFDAPTDAIWTLSPGTGYQGADQIILPAGSFIGTMDSGPVYDIISISEDSLTVMGPLVGAAGWFTFKLVKKR